MIKSNCLIQVELVDVLLDEPQSGMPLPRGIQHRTREIDSHTVGRVQRRRASRLVRIPVPGRAFREEPGNGISVLNIPDRNRECDANGADHWKICSQYLRRSWLYWTSLASATPAGASSATLVVIFATHFKSSSRGFPTDYLVLNQRKDSQKTMRNPAPAPALALRSGAPVPVGYPP